MSTVRREIVLPVERERAWALLTEPAELREWLADEVELEPEEGAPLRVTWATAASRARAWSRRSRSERRLRFRWDDDATGDPVARRVDARRRIPAAPAWSSRSGRSSRSRSPACRSTGARAPTGTTGARPRGGARPR